MRDLHILKIVAANGWGANFGILRSLYVALVRSKLDFACFLYHPSAPSSLLLLDRVQYAGARVMLGALRCTPVDSLESEADLMPLAWRRLHLLMKYAARSLSVPSHPVRQLLIDFYPYHFYETQPHPMPALALAFAEFRALGLLFTAVPSAPLASGYLTSRPFVRTSLHTAANSGMSDRMWCSLFADLLSDLRPRTPIYTDGSRRGGLTGSGVWCPPVSLLSRLSEHSSVFSAELFAIYSAVTYFLGREGTYVIFTDSLSSLHALQSVTPRSHYLVLAVASLLARAGDKFLLEWVPAHVGIPGNEHADSLAKQALDLPRETSTHLSPQELHRLFHNYYYSQWQSSWSASSSRLLAIKPQLGMAPYLASARRDQVRVSRLRLGATRLTHGHHFTGSPPVLCQPCSLPWTREHLLVSCPHLSDSRAALSGTCHDLALPLTVPTLLADDFPSQAVLQFLADVGLAHEL